MLDKNLKIFEAIMDSNTDSNSSPSLSPLQSQIHSDSDGDIDLKSLSPEPPTTIIGKIEARHQILPLFLPKPYTKPVLMRVKSVQAPESPTTNKSPTFDEVPSSIQIQLQANGNGLPDPLVISPSPIAAVLKPQVQRSKSNPPIPPKPDMSKFKEKASR